MRPDKIHAVAEAWASIDGKLPAFIREMSIEHNDWNEPGFTGHYLGYIEEAKELIKRIEKRGFTVVPLLPET